MQTNDNDDKNIGKGKGKTVDKNKGTGEGKCKSKDDDSDKVADSQNSGCGSLSNVLGKFGGSSKDSLNYNAPRQARVRQLPHNWLERIAAPSGLDVVLNSECMNQLCNFAISEFKDQLGTTGGFSVETSSTGSASTAIGFTRPCPRRFTVARKTHGSRAMHSSKSSETFKIICESI